MLEFERFPNMKTKNDTFLHFPYPLDKTLVLVGMMGCGKSSIGKRLARIYSVPFIDADIEIEKAGGGSCSDLFVRFGEAEFRRGEERVMERLIKGKICILASGGGAFLSENTRKLAAENAVTLFLDADIETIIRNTAGRTHRPLINTPNPTQTVRDLLKKRRGVYETANLRITYKNETLGQVLRRVVTMVNDYAQNHRNSN